MARKKQEQCIEDTISFEDALSKLEAIVKQLEQGDLSLDQSLDQYAQGVRLSRLCLAKLNSAEDKITKVITEANGKIVESNLDFQEEE
ncbi:MAG: exodeoxyribonuclease VII small subunit [Veillonellaceae bacterium]|jgi:exodeoxyribonuclease VII small subunit|nr:exodeoxyribonuclease VII small subunit [Veillonellaceae bacterium]